MLLSAENVLKPTLATVWLDKVKEDFSEDAVDASEVANLSDYKAKHGRRLRRMQSQNGIERAVYSLFEVLGLKNAA